MVSNKEAKNKITRTLPFDVDTLNALHALGQ